MSEEQNLIYAYFRFYVDDEIIRTGLNQYCTGYSAMQQVGYNYKEYKCFADNPGGLSQWVGSVGGYLSYTRETGFMDGSPSDGVYDQTLLMGIGRIITDNIKGLTGFPVDTKFIFRKIVAQDSGVAHKVNFKFGENQSISHPCMYTLDSTQVEILKQVSEGITNNTDVDSYELTLDVDKNGLVGSYNAAASNDYSGGDISNMFDMDFNNYYEVARGVAGWCNTVIDLGSFTKMSIKTADMGTFGTSYVYWSLNGTDWTSLGSSESGVVWYDVSGINGRYVKISNYHATYTGCKTYVYELIAS